MEQKTQSTLDARDSSAVRGSGKSSDFQARVQVDPEHYGFQYEDAARWISYGTQVHKALECHPESVLEIGMGNGTVTAILRSRGVSVTTIDIDSRLNPDIVGSVQELTNYVKDKSFDVVLCGEVLEHLPFDLLSECCKQLATVARARVLIGLPCCAKPRWGFGFQLRLPRFSPKTLWYLGINPLPKWRTDPEHYWAVDFRPYTLSRVCREVGESLEITEVHRDAYDPHHVMLVCSPKQ